MNLNFDGHNKAVEAYNGYTAGDTFEAIAGDRVVVGLRRGVENILELDETVPAGKKWTVYANIRIFEFDV